MLKARLIADRDMKKAAVDRRIYSSFIEHLGRAVYSGIYEPGHPEADENGFRKDVIRLIRELDVPYVRYPGGNFVSCYRWEDGVGPVAERPARLDAAWKTLEPNTFGLDEAAAWAKAADTKLMMAVNLGTRGLQDAVNLLEYCNIDAPSKYAQMRKDNGHKDPYGIKLWCLGNEMDGKWQTGHKKPEEYARIAAETARAMKRVDPSIELVACGSSGSNMATFPEWERIVLTEAYDAVDYISMHQYYDNYDDDAPSFLAASTDLDRFIKTVITAADYAKAVTRSSKTIGISLDEWNVWYHTRREDDKKMDDNPWQIAPHLLEDIYNAEDALVVGCMLITILRNAERVRIACLAQLVNVIAPIMTRKGGGAWRQTIYYPFMHASRYGRGKVVETAADSALYDSGKYGDVPYLESVAVLNEAEDELTVFAVNRSLSEDMELALDLRGFGKCSLIEHIELRSDDLKAINTEEKENVRPVVRTDSALDSGTGSIILRPASWNTIRIKVR